MSEDVLSILTEAVKGRRCCAMRYRDQLQARVVEPHAIYEDASGEVIVDCYQVDGYSQAGRTPPFWRPFRLRKIAAATLLKKTFVPRRSEGFSPTRLRYRSGLLCIVSEGLDVRGRMPRTGEAVGPFLPPKAARHRP